MVKFRCPRCAQKIAVNDEGIGVGIACPNCASGIVVPAETDLEFCAAPAPAVAVPALALSPAKDPQMLLREALLPHLARVMKDKLLRALMTQRRLLMDTQLDAAQQIAEFEQRLVKIQAQYQQRLRAYERRIAELEKQLADQQAENQQRVRALLSVTARSMENQSAAEIGGLERDDALSPVGAPS